MSWSRFQLWLQSVPSRIVGSHVELASEQPTRLSSWARFPADERLQLRLKAARDLIGDVQVKPDRRLIESQPDTFVEPQHVDELPIG